MILWPLALFVPVLVFVMYSDLRWMRIPNWTSLLAVLLFAVALPWLGWDEALTRLSAAAAVFGLGFVLFALRILAGGDVKFLSALMLLIPGASYTLFGLVFSAAMLGAILTLTLVRATPAAAHSKWVGMRAKAHMPMGVAMGMAGLVQLIWIAQL